MEIDLEKVHDVMVDALDLKDLRQLLNYKFNLRLDDVVGNVGLSEAVEKILDRFKRRGLLPQLIAEIAAARPNRPDVQAVYRDYAASLVSASKQADVDAKVKEAYTRFFGGKPPVVIQKAGQEQATVPTKDAGLERTLRADLGFLDVAQWTAKLERQSARVCRVELNDADGTMGTGFLVGPDALLTNYHVLQPIIDGTASSASVKFRFDYETRPDGTPSDGLLVDLAKPDEKATWLLGYALYSAAEAAGHPDDPPPTTTELDYALVRLARKIGDEPVVVGGAPRGWIEVPEAQPSFSGLPLWMILQHPNRKPLKLAFDTNPGVEVKHGGLRVRYSTNTEGGSSGSPCFDKDWKLLALHHYGDPAFSHPKFNQGVPITLIRNSLGDAARAALGGRCL
jgi:V8-like Glu-specific endopeptidase